MLDPVAKALGITTDELKTDLAKGQSIADIAKAKNVDLNKVIDALVADATAKIDKLVTDKHNMHSLSSSRAKRDDPENQKQHTSPSSAYKK